MTRLFTHNLLIKFVCLGVALCLWLYVAANQSTVGKFPSSLKIKSLNTPSGLVATFDTKTVNIKINAEPSVWKVLSPESFSAYLDLSGQGAGTYELPVNVVSSVPNVQIVDKSPQRVMVTLEPIISKEIGINSKIEGSAGDGLVAGTIELNPDKVTIKGAKSLVSNVTEAFVDVTLSGESADFSRNISLYALDDQGEAIKDIEFTPAETAAKVSIVKASNNKTVGIKIKTTGSPKTGFYVSSLTGTPAVVDIIGPQTIIKDLKYIETSPLDLSNIDSDIDKEATLNLPSGVTLQSGASATIKVKIVVAEGEISKELLTSPSFNNLDSAYKVANVTPTQIKALVAGPASRLNILKSTDLVYPIDLAGKGEGIYSFDISSKNYSLPDGVSVISVLPSSISVTLEKK